MSEFFEMSVKHPLLDVPLALAGREISLSREQYCALVDELCSIIFCCPHLAQRILDLARELKLEEVLYYHQSLDQKLRAEAGLRIERRRA